MSEICPTCHQTIKQAREHNMTVYLVKLLKAAAGYVAETKTNDFKMADINDRLQPYGPSAYNNFKHLRYFGLIHHPMNKQTGKRYQRRWLVTKQGWEFLRGEWDCRKSVVIKNNEIQEDLSTDQRINVRRVGAPMETEFLYFDDDGRPVGRRPQEQTTNNQQSLLDVPPVQAQRFDPRATH